jgi:hypothetical protein
LRPKQIVVPTQLWARLKKKTQLWVSPSCTHHISSQAPFFFSLGLAFHSLSHKQSTLHHFIRIIIN